MIKLLALDLDGTLMESGVEVSPRNQAALIAARNKGVAVTICTGRMFRSAQQVASRLDLDIPIITYNGAYIKTAVQQEVLLDLGLDQAIAHDIVAGAKAENLQPLVFIDDKVMAAYINMKVANYGLSAGVPVRGVGDLPAHISSDVNKILLIGDTAVLRDFWRQSECLYGDKVHIVQSKSHYLDFINPKANKGRALSFLAQGLNITQEQIMAIGDSYNDIGLFQAAGLKIAMGNAVEELKRQADYITADCRNDGLALAVEKFILE